MTDETLCRTFAALSRRGKRPPRFASVTPLSKLPAGRTDLARTMDVTVELALLGLCLVGLLAGFVLIGRRARSGGTLRVRVS